MVAVTFLLLKVCTSPLMASLAISPLTPTIWLEDVVPLYTLLSVTAVSVSVA